LTIFQSCKDQNLQTDPPLPASCASNHLINTLPCFWEKSCSTWEHQLSQSDALGLKKWTFSSKWWFFDGFFKDIYANPLQNRPKRQQKSCKLLGKTLWASNMAHQSPQDLQFFDKSDFGPIQYLFNNFSPFHLPEARSIPLYWTRLALSPEKVMWKNDIEILSVGINSEYFWSKSPKKNIEPWKTQSSRTELKVLRMIIHITYTLNTLGMMLKYPFNIGSPTH
jgi:hypothetical protein